MKARSDDRNHRPARRDDGDRASFFEDEETLARLALAGDVDALLRWRALADPIPYEELGWGD